MAFQFVPPTQEEGITNRADADPTTRALFDHFSSHSTGVTVLKKDGVYTEHEAPYLEDILAADIVYRGAHIYEVDAAEKADLEAAGYTVETV